MELIKWQNVIVEWVNCLNISKPVQTIGDLKNEDFFKKLLLFITPSDQNSGLDRSIEDISLTEFLKKNYPAYSLQHNSEVETAFIQDDIEISNICSLLLHYCCFIDGRQELIVPLCKELNTSYQSHIKSFLEDLQESHSITRELLIDTITNCTKYTSPTKFSSSFDSPKLVGNIPLAEFLKTPLKKQQVYDSHKKEINHLQEQLDLERFEKADLQEEINLQYEKNKKLDKIITNKQLEISRLRSEILALESRTPESNTKTDERLQNKRFRDEITSLEKYVEILHKEQEEVQTERDKAREKLRKVEETCNDWQSRALNSERQCSNISEENEYQRDELIQLREKCEELSSILREINAKNVCDESYEIDHLHAELLHNRSGSIDYDCLAHTVVDVQLVDAQEENKNLRKQICELEVNKTELSTQMNQLQLEITKIRQENKRLVDEKTNLNTSIIELRKKLSETEFNLAYYQNENESLSNDLKSSIEANNNLNEQLWEKVNDFNHLLSEKCKLHSKLDESTQKLLNLESENGVLKEFCEQFNRVLESYLIKFETELKEFSESSTEVDNILKLQNLVTALDHKIQNESNTCNYLLNQNSCLQEDFSALSTENGLLKEFLIKFNEVFESCLIKFEEEFQEYTAEPSTGNDNISKLQDLVSFLENKVKSDAQNFKQIQENSNSLLNRITNLQDEVTALYNNEIDSQKEKSNLQICLENSKSKIQQLDEEICNNNKLILICKSTIEEKSSEISLLKNVILSKDKLVEDLNKDKDNLTFILEVEKNKLSEEMHARDLADKRINILTTTLQEEETKLLHFEEDIVTYKSIFEEKFGEISSLQEELNNKNKLIKKLDKEICDIKNKLLQEKQHTDVSNNKLGISESKILDLEILNEKKSKEICELKDIVATKDSYIEHLNSEKNNLTIRLVSTENILSEEKDTTELSEIKIKTLKNNLQYCESKIQDLTAIIDNTNQLNESYKSIIKETSNEFNEVVSAKDKLMKELEIVENNLLEEKHATELSQTEIFNLKSNLQKVKSKLKDDNKLIETYKAVIEEKSIELTSQKVLADKKVNILVLTLQEAEKKLHQFEEEIITYKSTIKEKTSEITSLKDVLFNKDTLIKDLTKEICDIKNNLSEEKQLKDIANNEIVNMKTKLQFAESKILELETFVEEKSKEIYELKENIATNDRNMKHINSENSHLIFRLTSTENILSAEKDAKTLAETEIENLKSNLQDLTVTIDNNNKLIKSYKSIIEEKSKELNDLVLEFDNEKCYLSSTLKIVENKLLEEKHATELAQTEIINLKSNLQEAELKLEDNNKLIETYKAVIEEKSIELSCMVASKENLDKEKFSLTTTLQTVENKLFEETRIKEQAEKDYQQIEEHLNERENCIRSLEIQKVYLKDNVESLNKELLNEKNTKTQLEEKCTKLQTIIAEVEAQMHVLQNDKRKLDHQLENVQQELYIIQTNNTDLTKTILDKDNHLQKLEKQKQKLNVQKENLEKELHNAKDSKEVLNSKLEEMKKSVEEKSNHISKLELENIDLQNSVVNLDRKLLEATQQKDEIEAQLKDITKLLNQKETCIKSLENDKNTIQEQIVLLNKNLTSQELELSNKITEQLKRNHQLESEIDILNQNSSMINTEVSTIVNMLKSEEDIDFIDNGELSKTISNLKNNIYNLIIEKRQQNSETTILQKKIADLEHLKSSFEKYHDKLYSESKKKIKDLTKDKEKYTSVIETYRKKLDDVQTDLIKSVSTAESMLLDHGKAMMECDIVVQKLREQNDCLTEEIRQLKHRESNMTADLLAVKTEFKETIINYQQSLDTQEEIKQKNLQLAEEKTILALKLDQVTDDCTQLQLSHAQKLQEIEEVKNYLSSHEKIIQELKEKISAKDDLVTEQDKKISDLNLKLTEFVQELQILSEEKNKFVSQLSVLNRTLNQFEQSRKEISKEMEQKILDAEETMNKMKINFNNKIEVMEMEKGDDLEINKQLKNNVESLTKQLADISSDKNNLITLCKESCNKIHSIYAIVFENKEDKHIIEQINKINQQDNRLESFYDEKDVAAKEFDFITNEITVLKKTFKELSNYDTLKSENSVLKTKLSEIENKLLDIQLETTRYQKQLTEKEIDHKKTKDKYEKELDLMKAIIAENEAEHNELLQKTTKNLEKTINELKLNIKDSNNKFETATHKISTLDSDILNLKDKIIDYKKIITDLENDNIKLSKNFNELSEQHKIFMEKCKQDHTQTDKDELTKLRSVYSDLMIENSRLQLECTVLKKTVEDRNNQLSDLSLIKDAYKKLLEENNKVNMELDTLKCKRTRDKVEFKRIFEENNAKSEQEIKEIRSEYEEQLKKMKEKIMKLYIDEVENEKKKACTEQQRQAEETISNLKSELWVTVNKYANLKNEYEKLHEQLSKIQDHHQLELLEIKREFNVNGSRASVRSLRERRAIHETEERRTSTLPRDMKISYAPHSQQIDVIEESFTISRKRRSVTAFPESLDSSLKMEDEEGEFLNNKHLADLKAGKCMVSDRDSICRLSELQFRNSLCPPHLKSSYPAETQFTNPGQCNEVDIKIGTLDLDDSMNSSFSLGAKPWTKKNFGQTLYRKPGPPTPSKNGGRFSIQGNKVQPHEVLREHNPGRTTSTPNRIKALFTRSGTSSRDTENMPSPRAPAKRRSIFRR